MFLFHPLLTSAVLLLIAAAAKAGGAGEKNEEVLNLVVVPTGTLYNGVVVPLVGLGCASGVREEHVSNALTIGYRFLDTAQSYNWGYHEDEVGTALQQFNNNDNDNDNNNDSDNNDPNVFVQTKIHPEDLGYEATKRAIRKSLKRLQVQKLDSVLIHKPRCWEGACTRQPEGTWQDSWKALEEFYDAGVITKSIGICDVSSDDLLEELLSQRIKPHIIQNWMDPLHQDIYMRQQIQSNGILYQAYSSLGTQWKHHKGHSQNPVMNHPVLLEIAKAHADVNANVGQVVINWATIRHGISILPASTNPIRQEGNLYNSFRFALTKEELDRIDALDGKFPKDESKSKSNNEISIQFQSEDDSNYANTVDVYWIGHGGNEEVNVGSVGAGRSLSVNTYHGHTFRFRDNNANVYGDHTIQRESGNHQVHIIVPDNDEEEL